MEVYNENDLPVLNFTKNRLEEVNEEEIVVTGDVLDSEDVDARIADAIAGYADSMNATSDAAALAHQAALEEASKVNEILDKDRAELTAALDTAKQDIETNKQHIADVGTGLEAAQQDANTALAEATQAKEQAAAAIDAAHSVEQTAADALAKAEAAQASVATAEQAAQQAAADAQRVADDLAALAGKTGRVIHSDTAPTGSDAHENNLWLNPSTGVVHHWDGEQWQEITDPAIAEAANKADQAYNLADSAQAAASQAATLADAANTLATSATTVAENAQASALAASSEAQTAKSEAEAARAEALSASEEADAAVQAAADAIAKAESAESKALAAQKAADDAAAKATTADGRVTVATANPTTNDALGKPEGAIWEVRSGTSVPRRFMLVNGAWTQVKIGQDFIGDNAIGSAQIIDAAIGTAKIAGLAVTDAKIGSLNVAKLVADTSRMNQLAVEKIIGDAAYFNALQANKVVVAGDPANKVDAITLADGAVTTPKLKVTSDMWTKMLSVAGDASIGGNLIVNNTITADKLVADSLMANKISANLATLQKAWIRDAHILDLAASKITTGRLSVGTKITVGDPAEAHAILGHDGLHLMANPDGSGTREVAQMGTGSAAVWSVTGPVQSSSQDGDVYPILAQATADGDVIAQDLRAANDVYVGGESIFSLLNAALPRPVGMFTTTVDQTASGKVWKNAGLITFPMRANRLYQIVLNGVWGLDTAADGRLEMSLNYSYAADQTTLPPDPWVNGVSSTRLATWGQSVDAHMENGAKHGFNYTHWLLGWGDRDFLRVGFAFVNWGSPYQVRLGKGARMVVIDHGAVGNDLAKGYELNSATPADQLPGGGGEQAPVVVDDKVQQWTITFTADALKSWRGGSPTTPLQHGTYGGVQRFSHMSMPDMSKVTGAVEVLKVEVWLKCTHVRWSAGVDVAIGTSLNDTVTSPQTSGSYPERSRWRAGEAKWVELKGQVHKARAKAGQLRGIVLGEGANSESMYAHFSMLPKDVKLRVTYRK